MSAFRLLPEAEAELDGIWIHMACESGSIDIANAFGCWPGIRTWGDGVTICAPVCAASPLAITSSSTALWRTMWRSFCTVVHGSRDIAALFGD
jgi:hypothetical protein